MTEYTYVVDRGNSIPGYDKPKPYLMDRLRGLSRTETSITKNGKPATIYRLNGDRTRVTLYSAREGIVMDISTIRGSLERGLKEILSRSGAVLEDSAENDSTD